MHYSIKVFHGLALSQSHTYWSTRELCEWTPYWIDAGLTVIVTPADNWTEGKAS